MSQSEDLMLRRIVPHLQKVLIVDPSPHAARLLGDLLKELGGRMIHVETAGKAALAAARAIEPQMVFTEFSGPSMNGVNFVRELRRSSLACRMAPVIMVTSEATAASIIASRDAGVHEFLRKPFTMKDLMRRLEAVCLKPRPWIEAVQYVGPDRRRFNSGDYQGARKRKSDNRPPSQVERVGQALKILRAAIDAVDTDPKQALRAMQAQVAELHAVAMESADVNLASAAAELHRVLKVAVFTGKLSRSDLEACSKALWAFRPPEAPSARAG